MAASFKSAALSGEPAPLAKAIADLARTAPWQDALAWFVRQKQWMNDQHLQLCRIPAPTFFEQRRAEWMLAQFRALGCVARIDRAGNVIAHPLENRDGPYIALTAHLDTVLAPRKDDEVYLGPDGRLHGPGVSDNGAGLTALLAIARLVTSSPDLADACRNLLFIANIGEEGEGNLSGMRHLCRQSSTGARIRAFVILDGPHTDHVTSQALASRRFDVTVSGPGGHSWSDYGVANPVHALARAISAFTEQRLPTNGSPRSSYNFGILEGGTSINSIPALARTKVDIRSESAARLDEIAAVLTNTVERAIEVENDRATGGKVSGKIREIGSRPGGRLPDDAYILQAVRAADAHLGIRSHLDCASTDANIPLSMGLAAVSIGAGGHGGGAHTPQEWFHPEGRELGLKRVLLTLALLLHDLESRADSRNGG
ncbi:MAG TPA: M20/M25/M40 family metallo-hydrolase [Bryobacteraceae bacterium]|nr:M20/M25/M40 family metallo-hydrolase [Bryobacteraceae bacterium]